MVDRRLLALMKKSAFLVNAARGGLVVEKDLAEALAAGRLAGAAVDTVSREPVQADNPLLAARNCIVTPHIAWATREARAGSCIPPRKTFRPSCRASRSTW